LRALNAGMLLMLFSAEPQTLTDQVFEIPAKEWRYVDVAVKQVPITVDCEYRVISGTGAVRVELVNGEGLDDWKQGHGETGNSEAFARQGGFRRVLSVPDDYAVVVENGGRGETSVRLRVSLDSSERGRPQARYLSAERRLAVVVISATVFLAIVSYSAKKLLGVMRG